MEAIKAGRESSVVNREWEERRWLRGLRGQPQHWGRLSVVGEEDEEEGRVRQLYIGNKNKVGDNNSKWR